MVDINDNNVFIFWVGREYKIIKFLRALIYHHSNNGKNYKVHFINYDNLRDYIKEEIPECFWKLSPMHQSDYLRVQVIYHYGGIWLDSDTIVMDDLSSLFEILDQYDGFLVQDVREKTHISTPGNYLVNGIFGSRPKTKLMNIWKREIDITLQQKEENIGWTDLGEVILNRIKYKYEIFLDTYVLFDGRKNVYPVPYAFMKSEFIEKPYENWKNIIREYQPLIILTHLLYKEVDDLSESELLSNTPLSYFIKQSYSLRY